MSKDRDSYRDLQMVKIEGINAYGGGHNPSWYICNTVPLPKTWGTLQKRGVNIVKARRSERLLQDNIFHKGLGCCTNKTSTILFPKQGLHINHISGHANKNVGNFPNPNPLMKSYKQSNASDRVRISCQKGRAHDWFSILSNKL